MRVFVNFFLPVFWAVVMIVLFTMPPSATPNVPHFEGFDKLVHCGVFFVFTSLLLHSIILNSMKSARKINSCIWVFIIATSFAFLTEGIQLFLTKSRHADWWDIFADMVGIGMAIFAFLLFFYKRTKDSSKSS